MIVPYTSCLAGNGLVSSLAKNMATDYIKNREGNFPTEIQKIGTLGKILSTLLISAWRNVHHDESKLLGPTEREFRR
jgi:hypothetical protein